ncbi:MAG: homocysteine S-methyltransferase family protein [Desulfobacterales bacterium]|nr:homocysteine S-methyltransferase family protein [Desulfobacterales bacterium]MDD4071278.1 homocysteine S-methyltransferase family protein [Desulfobacterales bacterium]MDD4393329.1 homocysteine S-methyltransferase family protein [Desulfobacterales bacterium]
MKDVIIQPGKNILIGSGAIGTCLRQNTNVSTDPVEMLNLTSPESVRALHLQYKAAGSQILLTNTFAANPLVLGEIGMASKCHEINEAGVRLAREAGGNQCLIWASAGPLALGLRRDDYDAAALKTLFVKQCEALTQADAIVFETFTDAKEATAAVSAAAQINMPFIFQVGNVGGGPNRWQRIRLLISIALDAGAMAVGTNCLHPNEILDVVDFLTASVSVPVTVSPNAGHPVIRRGLVSYTCSPDDFASIGEKLSSLGASVIGGCCGTTPEHIRKLALAVKGKPVGRRQLVEISKIIQPAISPEKHEPARNRIRDLIQSDAFVTSVEIRADRKQSLEQIISGAAQIADAGVSLFDVPDNPGATVGRDAMVVTSRLQDKLNVPSICHKSVTQSNLLQLHSCLIGCWDLGLQGILAVTGDSPSMGHLGTMARMVTDLKSSVELLRLIKTLRQGRMINEEEIADPPDLCAGCAFGRPEQSHLKWLGKKIDAGAEFVFSQPVFTADDVKRLLDSVSAYPIRMFPGIMPLVSRKNAEFFASGRIPGIKVPSTIADQFDRFEKAEDQRRLGLDMAAELAQVIAAEARGIYIIMPFGKNGYSETARLVRSIQP